VSSYSVSIKTPQIACRFELSEKASQQTKTKEQILLTIIIRPLFTD
jgi:hypothetical protein